MGESFHCYLKGEANGKRLILSLQRATDDLHIKKCYIFDLAGVRYSPYTIHQLRSRYIHVVHLMRLAHAFSGVVPCISISRS